MTSPASWRCDPRRLSRLLLILGSAVTLVESSPGETRAADSHVEAIAKKIAWQTETRKSVELRVRTTIAISHPPPRSPAPSTLVRSTTSKWPANGDAIS